MADGMKRAGFIAWLVTVVVPPAVLVGPEQQFVTHHPAWVVIIGVAYLAVAGIGGFFVVVARDVSSRWQVRLPVASEKGGGEPAVAIGRILEMR